jgi:nucleoside-diphosphate-sugar epimerase
MSESVLITGAAGFIGSHLVAAALDEGYKVTALDNLSTGNMHNLSLVEKKIDFVEGDITDADAMLSVCENCDYVLHHAAKTSVRESVSIPKEYNRVNIDGTINMLEAAKESGIKRLVLAASSAAYGESDKFPQDENMLPAPASPYALAKVAGEYYCSLYHYLFGVQAISLRYFNVYGPRQDPGSQYAAVVPIFAAKLAVGEKPTIFGTGEQARDFVSVYDVCRANMLALKADPAACGGVFNVASGTAISVNELYALIAGLLGKSDVEPLRAEKQPGDVMKTCASVELSRQKLGFEAKVLLEDGLKETVEFFSNRAS